MGADLRETCNMIKFSTNILGLVKKKQKNSKDIKIVQPTVVLKYWKAACSSQVKNVVVSL